MARVPYLLATFAPLTRHLFIHLRTVLAAKAHEAWSGMDASEDTSDRVPEVSS